MGLELQYEEGQTPLSEEEKEGLLIKTITTHAELDEYEQLNIENAVEWLMNKKVKKDKILTEDFIRALHKRMFGKVWKWAGGFRQSEKNIGVKWINIRTDLKVLLDDTSYWINNDTFPPDEIAIRFKHRLVNIHCFPNGNGRHSRLMADIIVESIFEKEIFSWHSSNMIKADEVRKEYIKSIRLADNGDIEPLMKFART
ncbi:MAG: cell filamentation protein Fic [Bacteroidetes bacterium HGW-Bacteroidetes-23]|nr:MAG: cell filamentation protein Fic [Bacteroidetes bacterium HGW-Bacteroidetes-23]